ncbi:MAG: flagellar hook assembly protein FlgD [Pseudomonadales bacterium]
MTEAISTGLLSELSIRERQVETKDSKELDQDVFLRLMVTQMQHQDPLDPQSNSDFVAQLAQFSSVEGLDKLNNTMEGFVGSFQSGQALQASSMVGRMVKVDTDTSYLATGGIVAGTIDLPQSTNEVRMVISDSSGVQVTEVLMGSQEAGEITFAWDGQDDAGNQQGPGYYTFEVFANIGGDPVQIGTALSANVDSVTVGANGAISLNVAGVGAVPMSGVREIL